MEPKEEKLKFIPNEEVEFELNLTPPPPEAEEELPSELLKILNVARSH